MHPLDGGGGEHARCAPAPPKPPADPTGTFAAAARPSRATPLQGNLLPRQQQMLLPGRRRRLPVHTRRALHVRLPGLDPVPKALVLQETRRPRLPHLRQHPTVWKASRLRHGQKTRTPAVRNRKTCLCRRGAHETYIVPLCLAALRRTHHESLFSFFSIHDLLRKAACFGSFHAAEPRTC